MGLITTILTAIGLAMDAFAVSIADGVALSKVTRKKAFKIGLFFGLFQFAMPIAGWVFGLAFGKLMLAFDHWIAFVLLAFIGGKMIYESRQCEEEGICKLDDEIMSNKNLITQAIATSIDALSVGIIFAALTPVKGNLDIFSASTVIGVIAFTLSFIGVLLGEKLGEFFKSKAELVGGLILVGIGIKVLVEHLFF